MQLGPEDKRIGFIVILLQDELVEGGFELPGASPAHVESESFHGPFEHDVVVPLHVWSLPIVPARELAHDDREMLGCGEVGENLGQADRVLVESAIEALVVGDGIVRIAAPELEAGSKEIVHIRFDPGAKTYWTAREEEDEDPKRYFRQF